MSAALVIAIGYVVSLVIPELLVLTPALEARTEPGLLDLGVALAAGAAGAFVAARHTGSDALPGVAIAVSLVPPLATVGICLEQGRIDDAGGAMILFTDQPGRDHRRGQRRFLLSGARPIAEGVDERRRMRVGVAAATIALVLISLPLVWHSAQTISCRGHRPRGHPGRRGSGRKRTPSRSSTGTSTATRSTWSSPVRSRRPTSPAGDAMATELGHPVHVSVTYQPVTRYEARPRALIRRVSRGRAGR